MEKAHSKAKLLILMAAAVMICLALAAGCSGKPKGGGRAAPPLNDQAANLTNLGAALLMEGEYIKALPQLLSAKELSPRNADIENYLGLAYYGMKEYDLATQSYNEALRLDPSRTDVRNNLGLVFLAQDDYDRALEQFNLCLKDLVYQKQQLTLSNLALVYIEMGRLDEAMVPLIRATEITPDYGKAYQLIGRIHMARHNYMEAVDYLNNAARLEPNDQETYMALGDAFTQMNKPEEAAQAYSQVPVLVPNTPMALEAQKRARRVMGFE